MKISAIVFSLCMIPGVAVSGPFGIDMGTPLSNLESTEQGNKIVLDSVPNPHPDFDTYVAWGANSTGTCLVMAISSFFENDAYGTKVRSSYEKFKSALTAKYGPPILSVDRLAVGALWDEPRDWVMAIKQNERFYGDSWELVEPETHEGISGIEMQIVALTSNASAIKLFYKFENFDACEAAMEAEANSSF